MPSNKNKNYISGINTEDIFDELVLHAENESAGYPDAPEHSVNAAVVYMKSRFDDMLEDLRSEVTEEVKLTWNGEE